MSIHQLSRLLPLPDDELQQVLDYAATLSKPEAVTHFSNLLGDSPPVIDFISTFNARRKDPTVPRPQPAAAPIPSAPSSSKTQPNSQKSAAATETIEPVPKHSRQAKKKKAPLHALEARKVDDYAGPAGKAYSKKDSDLEYITQRSSAPNSNQPSRGNSPPRPSIKEPTPVKAQPAKAEAPAPQQKASAASGYLISDGLRC